MAYVRHRSRIMAINVLLSYNFAAVFFLQFLGNGPMNRGDKKSEELKMAFLCCANIY